MYLPLVTFDGRQNGYDTSFTFYLGIDSVWVMSPALIRIDSTNTISRNAPFVNIAQPCSIKVTIENLGWERADSFYIHLATDGASQFPDSMLVSSLDGRHNQNIVFHLAAGASSNPNEIFNSSVSGGKGNLSGNPLQIGPPLDNNALLITEIPADLALSSINIIGPPGALDSTISIEQPLTVSVTVRNLGEADISQPRILTLYPGDANWGVDSLQRDYILGQPVIWHLTAPPIAVDSAGFSIGISGSPIDLNDGSPAIGPNGVSLIWFAIENRASIDHSASITEPAGAADGILSTDQTIIVRDILSPHGLYRSKAVQLILPDGFTTQDSLVKYPSSDTAFWHLRAPSAATVDTANIACWIFDLNRGDSSEAPSISIPLTVVDAAELQISTSIIGPPSAQDGIIEPGGHFQFEAMVRNLGQSGVSAGRMTIQTGRSDITTDIYSKNFVVGEPIDWTINLPNEEIPLPVPIWVTIDSIPIEENTNLPAHVLIDSAGVSIVVRELFPRLVLAGITSNHSGSAFKGQQLGFATIDLQNRDFGGNFDIGIMSLSVIVNNNPDLPAGQLLSSATLGFGSESTISGIFQGDTILFSQFDTLMLGPSQTISFNLNFEINPATSVRDFTVQFAWNFVQAGVFENGTFVENITPVMPRGESVSWQSEPSAILEPNFTASLSSYPNPFSPQDGGTTIGYFLPAASNLEIRIFTLLGELVWTKTISAADPLGAAGLHSGSNALLWNATNDVGNEIRSGVYICMVRNLTSGEEAKFKIAVVK